MAALKKPFERLKACPGVDPKQVERLEKLKATLNPFRLKENIEKKLRRAHALPRLRHEGPKPLAPKRAPSRRPFWSEKHPCSGVFNYESTYRYLFYALVSFLIEATRSLVMLYIKNVY
ncbi:MAG: hypothetical protein WCH57_03620 [Verrucomicrobiota bacterium]